ncbi:MAG: hypothetical protein EXR72_06725 [Myxococcales bacterium]|nr:hypothetical protein [Myxococcales bacterium]
MHASAARRGQWLVSLAVAFAAAALCAPLLRYVPSLGDEGVWLHGAQRLLRGEAIYRDFFEFQPPLAYLIVAAWMRAFGETLLAARVLALAVIAATAGLTCALARRLGGGAIASPLFALGWVVCSSGKMMINHHGFTLLFAVAAALATVRALASERRLWTCLAGLLAGAASMVIPTRGALLCLACLGALLCARKRLADLVTLSVAMAIFPLAIALWLAAAGTLGDASAQILGFSTARYADIQWLPFGAQPDGLTWPLALVFPLGFALAGGVLILDRKAALRDREAVAAVLFAAAGLAGCWPRPNLFHIAYSAPLGLPLLAAAAARLAPRLPRWSRVAATACALLTALPVAVVYRQLIESASAPAIPLAAGSAVLGPGTDPLLLEPLLARLAAAPAPDRYFFYPYDPLLAFLTARRHAPSLDLFVPQYTTAAQYRATCDQVVGTVEWVVIDREWTYPARLTAIWPAMTDASPPEKEAFEAALTASFAPRWTNERYGIHQRRAAADRAICRRIEGASSSASAPR